MGKFDEKFIEVLLLWPEEIDISNGKIIGDNGFYSENLSIVWNHVESEIGQSDAWKDMLVWSIYGYLHKEARDSFINGTYKLYPRKIRRDSIFVIFHQNLIYAEGYDDVLLEFENEIK